MLFLHQQETQDFYRLVINSEKVVTTAIAIEIVICNCHSCGRHLIWYLFRFSGRLFYFYLIRHSLTFNFQVWWILHDLLYTAIVYMCTATCTVCSAGSRGVFQGPYHSTCRVLNNWRICYALKFAHFSPKMTDLSFLQDKLAKDPKFLTDNRLGYRKSRVLMCNIKTPLTVIWRVGQSKGMKGMTMLKGVDMLCWSLVSKPL